MPPLSRQSSHLSLLTSTGEHPRNPFLTGRSRCAEALGGIANTLYLERPGATSGLSVTQESHSRMPSMPAYTPRRAEKRHRQLILLPRGHPLVGGEELGESRLTELRGTHLAESTEHSCKSAAFATPTCLSSTTVLWTTRGRPYPP
jgi:hypothetical protein